jgi:hypothetical protein
MPGVKLGADDVVEDKNINKRWLGILGDEARQNVVCVSGEGGT